MSKTLVAYFSASGVTANVAKELAKTVCADLFEIAPEVKYTADDLDWKNKESRSSVEMADLQCRPAVSGKISDMNGYDTVYVGFPIWWGREPSVVDTFLEGYDFSGKRIIPFCTSGGSDIGKTAERIASLVSDAACVDGGKRLAGVVSPDELKAWTDSLSK